MQRFLAKRCRKWHGFPLSNPIPVDALAMRLLSSALHVALRVTLHSALLVGAASRVVSAQSVIDVVRGRVIDDSSHVVRGATVMITRGPDRLVQQTTTDSAGLYTSRFENGTGDYLVSVSAAGLKTARRRVQRIATERELVADFILSRDLALLATVKVTAAKPVRARENVGPMRTEVGASEGWKNGVQGQVTPSMAGDINTIAGTIAGVTVTPGGPSILGAASSSNLNTLNGMAMMGGSLPRAARVETRVTGATFDPTRGGFSGANIDTRLAPGDRSYQQRNAFFTLDAPQLQATDAVGRSLGLLNQSYRGSLGLDGELIRQVMTYNVSVDVSRNISDPATLIGDNTDAWRRAGVAADSVNRLLELATTAKVPVSGVGVPNARKRDAVTWLGRLDDIRDTLRTLTLTTYASSSSEGALGFGVLAAPASGGRSESRNMGAQFVYANYVGKGRFALLQNKIGASRSTQRSTPYLTLPGATVLVRSASDAGASDVAALTLGGSPWIATDDANWILEASNELSWNARGSKHRFKTQLWGRADGVRQNGVSNAFGQYTYGSLADFAANRPSSYSRTLQQPGRSAESYNAAGAIAHQWNQSRWFSMLYGARIEANAFGGAPPTNPALDAALGVRSGVAPTRVHVSPRLGFSYTYSRDKNNGEGMSFNQVGQFYRSVMGFVRGGIGEFRDLYKPSTLADAIAGSGLVGSTLSLSCVGAAVPVPDWNDLTGSTATFPTTCANGSGALTERAPSVSLIDPSFDVPRSWRANLSWASNVGRWSLKVDGLGTYDLSQPSTLDANFSGVQRFALPSEGNRPMYVSPSAIDATSGVLSPSESRRSSAFGRVALRTSDLRRYGGQLTTTIAPDVFRSRRNRFSIYTSASYTLQRLQQQFRGFDGATFGDPRTTEWGVGNNESRHAFVLSAGGSIPVLGTITLFSRIQSGMPFTPLAQGDINGDGRANDRAFVPALTGGTDAALSTQFRALLDATSGNARACLQRQLGVVAARNSCRGSWMQSLNVQWQPRIPIKVQGRNIVANVAFQNPLAGLDQLLNGSTNLRGWGTRALPDPVLLVPRGFDATTQRFRYDINPRFGDTRAFRTLSREPFRVTLDFSLNFSTPYDVQRLRQALEPVRAPGGGWRRRSVDSLTSFYMRSTSNLHRALLAESDSLFLSREQIAQLVNADSSYINRMRELYQPLAEYLSSVPGGVAGAAALDSANAAEKRYWTIFWEQVDIIRPIITEQQRVLLPLLKDLTDLTAEQRKNGRWYFGYAAPFVYTKPRIGGN